MSDYYSYTFDNVSRIGLDPCCQSQSDLQNVEYSTYMLQNYFASDCSMKKPIDLATSQPCVK